MPSHPSIGPILSLVSGARLSSFGCPFSYNAEPCANGRRPKRFRKLEEEAERAGMKLHCEAAGEGQRVRDRDAIERWAEAEGANLEGEAARAWVKLRNVDRPQS
jgi:hypothetical protein